MVFVFVIDHYNSKSDGICISARRYEDELTRQGHTVRIVAHNVIGENKFSLKELRVPYFTWAAKKSNIIFAKYDKDVLEQALDGADVVHLFIPISLARRVLRLAKKRNIPVTTAFHLHPDNVTKNSGVKLPAFCANLVFWYWKVTFYNKVRHIHCPSQFTADELIRHKYKSQLHVISNGITKNFRPPENKNYFTNDGSRNFEILMVARFSIEKRHDTLIEAIKRSKYKDRINLTFAGHGPQLKKLQELSQDLPNPPTFKFYSQKELLNKIHTSDLYVHAADTEIEGMSCMEAFAAGLTPIIGDSKKSATKQFIFDERCSFKSANPDSLRDKIEYFIEHPTELRELSEAYVEYAQKYSLENSVKSFVQMANQEIADNQRAAQKDYSTTEQAI